jgi:hypothetical protein
MLISKSQSLKISRSDIILLFNFVNSSPSFACQLFFAYCYNFASIYILYHIYFACIYKIKGGRQLFLLQKLDSTIECSISNVLSENVTSAQRATTILTLKSNTSTNVHKPVRTKQNPRIASWIPTDLLQLYLAAEDVPLLCRRVSGQWDWDAESAEAPRPYRAPDWSESRREAAHLRHVTNPD